MARGLVTAFAAAVDERSRMSPKQAAGYECQPERLRDHAAGTGFAGEDR